MKRSKMWKTRKNSLSRIHFYFVHIGRRKLIMSIRKAQLRGNVNVVPVYACANTHTQRCLSRRLYKSCARCQLGCAADYTSRMGMCNFFYE